MGIIIWHYTDPYSYCEWFPEKYSHILKAAILVDGIANKKDLPELIRPKTLSNCMRDKYSLHLYNSYANIVSAILNSIYVEDAVIVPRVGTNSIGFLDTS